MMGPEDSEPGARLAQRFIDAIGDAEDADISSVIGALQAVTATAIHVDVAPEDRPQALARAHELLDHYFNRAS